MQWQVLLSRQFGCAATGCAAGTYQLAQGASSSAACLTCTSGTYCAAGSSAVTVWFTVIECAPDAYQPALEASSSAAFLTWTAEVLEDTAQQAARQ